jgi:hypothetical protein
MLRYAILGVIGMLAGGGALAQQSPTQGESPTPSENSAASPKAAVTMEEPLPGDHWTYEMRDEIEGTVTGTRTITVMEVTPTEISTRFKTAGNAAQGQIIFDRSWNMVGSGPWRYSPNDGSGVRSPLEVGKTWTFQGNDINSANASNTWKRTGTAKVVAQEALTTKAGTFDTFKIETSYSTRNVNNPTKTTQVTTLTWYAPAIDHWVKRTFTSHVDKHLMANNSIELVEYGRKP